MLRGKAPKEAYSQRQLKVGEIIKKSLSDFLYRDTIHDEDLQSVSITITQVTMSPDLKQATAYIMPLGGNGTIDIVNALNKNSKYISCLLYTSPSPRDATLSRMPSSA